MIRVAAIADLHCTEGTCGRLAPQWEALNEQADVFLLGGDLTTLGTLAEARVLAGELKHLRIPMFAVLGNHDYQSGREAEVTRILEEEAGVKVLECSTATLTVGEQTLGIAGTKGFGGGFAGACATEFGEPEMKAYIRHTATLVKGLRTAMLDLQTDYRVLLLHYSPVETTLRGEPLPIYPFLGSYLFAEVADEIGSDLILHGHAHHGYEKGHTPAGIPVRNVAMPLVKHPYMLFHIEHSEGHLPFGDRHVGGRKEAIETRRS